MGMEEKRQEEEKEKGILYNEEKRQEEEKEKGILYNKKGKK